MILEGNPDVRGLGPLLPSLPLPSNARTKQAGGQQASKASNCALGD